MSNLKKLLESTATIRFPDCDAFRHLHNSRYIDYMINAREDQLLEAYGFDVYALARQKAVSWVVAQTQISYLTPAYLMEKVVIQTRLLSASDKGLLLEAMMWDQDKRQLKAVLWTKLVHFNLATQQSQTHAPELMTLFNSIVDSPDSQLSFENRIKELKALVTI